MAEPKASFAPTFFLYLGLLVVGAALYLVAPHISYYLTPVVDRPLHHDHLFLRPSGRAGLSFGLAGALLIILNLGYLIRKQLGPVRWLGSQRSWMAFHVFTGLTAGALVLLHSTLRPRSALGFLSFASMGIVVVTGLIGRYIYARTPRSLEGHELEINEIRKRLEEYRRRLESMGMPSTFFAVSTTPVEIYGSDKGLLEALASIIAGDRTLRNEKQKLRRLMQSTPTLHPLTRQALPLAEAYIRERQWVARYAEMRALMSGWRFLHRWLAILLIVAVAFHILIAARMGNLWIFNQVP